MSHPLVILSLLVLASGTALPADAQHQAPRFAAWRAELSAARVGPPALRVARRDFRWEGTTLGAIGLGIAGGLTGAAYCGNSESGPRDCTATTLGFALAGAAIGGVLGHFAGRLISK